MRIINIISIAISLIVFCGGMVLLGIKCLAMRDDALLHPPDPDDEEDPDHTQWPQEGEPL